MPNFGYETIGSLYSNCSSDRIRGSVFTITESGTADSISVVFYVNSGTLSVTGKCGVYKHSDLSLVGVTEEKTINLTTTPQFFTFNFIAPKPELIIITDYILVSFMNYVDTAFRTSYDTGSADQGHYQAISYGDFPNTLDPTHLTNKFSIYCTYTAAGGVIEKTFADVGAGSDGFLNPYRAMGISDVGHGSDTFLNSYRSMGFGDIGHGAEIFNTPFRTMSSADVAQGIDAFIKEIVTAITKTFSDAGYGVDNFIMTNIKENIIYERSDWRNDK
jgi:hypothetical protein